jgi:mono/diheme cytochrome c family protein
MRLIQLSLACVLLVAGCNQGNDQDNPQATKVQEQISSAAKDRKVQEDTDVLVKRGAYLSDLMGCELCHTPLGPQGPDQRKRFAGGLEILEDFGTWRSLNITQDKETGIGSWSDEEILAAIREGKRPNGDTLFPIMPYLFYNTLSDRDSRALVAFLRTVEPVTNKLERATELKMLHIPAPPPTGVEPNRKDPVAYGKYLTSMMHCAACHTPLGNAGPDMKRAFAGGMPHQVPELFDGILYSTNLTPHETGLKNWSDEQIDAAIRQMKKPDGSLIRGPMRLYQRGWALIPDEDVASIIAFLRTLPAQENKIPESTYGPPPGH